MRKGFKTADLKSISFPSDIVPSDKDAIQSWAESFSEAIINFGQWCYNTNDQLNFDCAYGFINPSDYTHITQLVLTPVNTPNGMQLKQTLPAKLRPINAVAHVVNKMIGKVEGEGLDFSAHVANEDAIASKLEDFSAEVMGKLTRYARQQSGLAQILGQPLHDEDTQPVLPESVVDMSFNTWQQENEIQISRGLRYLLNKQNLFLKYKLSEQGFRNYIITGKMAFDTYIENDPNMQSVDPRRLIYELDSNSPFIQHGRYAAYSYTATPQELLDRCPELTEDQIKYIEDQFQTLQANGTLRKTNPYWYWDNDLKIFYFTPYKCYWKAMKKIKVLVTPNRFDEENPHITFLGDKCESCKGTGIYTTEKGKEHECTVCKGEGEIKREPKKGEKIEYRYFNTIFECTTIGTVKYQCRELPGQHQPMDEPSYRELPIVGIIDPNPCIVGLLRPLQELRNSCWYTIERLLGQAKGKILVIDEAAEEDGSAQLYNMLSFGVYKYNSAKEGDNRQVNIPVERDMGLSQAVSDIMRLIAFIDANMNMVTGANDTSMGMVKSDQTALATQNAVTQNQLTLTPYYSVFYTVTEMTLQSLCNLMRPAWAGKKKTSWFMGDEGYEFLNLDPETKWDMADYGISVVNSVGANASKKLMIDMASQMLPTATEPEIALSILKMVRAKSDAECERVFQKGMDALRKVKQEQQQFQQQQFQQQQQLASQKMQQEAQIEQTKAESPMKVAQIKSATDLEKTKMKEEYKGDMKDVDFKNQILLLAADVLKEQQMKEIKPENKELQSA